MYTISNSIELPIYTILKSIANNYKLIRISMRVYYYAQVINSRSS